MFEKLSFKVVEETFYLRILDTAALFVLSGSAWLPVERAVATLLHADICSNSRGNAFQGSISVLFGISSNELTW